MRAPARRWAAGVAAAVLLLATGLGLTEAAGVTDVRGTVVRLFSPAGTLVVEVDDPAVSLAVGDELVITGAGAKEIRLKPGRHKVEATRDGKVVHQELVTVTRDGRQVVRITAGPVPSAGQVPAPPTVLAPALTLSRHTDGALAVAFAPNGKVFASVGKASAGRALRASSAPPSTSAPSKRRRRRHQTWWPPTTAAFPTRTTSRASTPA